jgi:prolyl-tRNA synthetase
VYQFQTKLRNEMRAKSGVMRGREFVMKDMYSFAADEASHLAYYESTKVAYMNVFRRLGIGDDTFVTFAAGGAFTKFSHEFQTICDAGEDVTYINREKGIAINEEVVTDETLASLGVTAEELTKCTTAEVGNIFNFGQQKAIDLGLVMKDNTGAEVPVWMGSYGIGITRLIGVLVEKFADEKGIVWPKAVAPFTVHLVSLNTDSAEIRDWADGVYANLLAQGVEVLYDDRDLRAGEKFADSDLIGIPYRFVVSAKHKAAGTVEVVGRANGATEILTEAEAFALVTKAG